ncbi:hypothetical protein ACHAC9_04875 [Massilia sp. CMS3.1]|uniref:hypothetical protein n=1 Tax=Massilia sp. CMS3.1 TaxID=3373083 RepID=UPI003EE5FE80
MIEALPWPGDTRRSLDNTNRGQNRVEVVDAKTGDLPCPGDFSMISSAFVSRDHVQNF